jgi:hypothetical protein
MLQIRFIRNKNEWGFKINKLQSLFNYFIVVIPSVKSLQLSAISAVVVHSYLINDN